MSENQKFIYLNWLDYYRARLEDLSNLATDCWVDEDWANQSRMTMVDPLLFAVTEHLGPDNGSQPTAASQPAVAEPDYDMDYNPDDYSNAPPPSLWPELPVENNMPVSSGVSMAVANTRSSFVSMVVNEDVQFHNYHEFQTPMAQAPLTELDLRQNTLPLPNNTQTTVFINGYPGHHMDVDSDGNITNTIATSRDVRSVGPINGPIYAPVYGDRNSADCGPGSPTATDDDSISLSSSFCLEPTDGDYPYFTARRSHLIRLEECYEMVNKLLFFMSRRIGDVQNHAYGELSRGHNYRFGEAKRLAGSGPIKPFGMHQRELGLKTINRRTGLPNYGYFGEVNQAMSRARKGKGKAIDYEDNDHGKGKAIDHGDNYHGKGKGKAIDYGDNNSFAAHFYAAGDQVMYENETMADVNSDYQNMTDDDQTIVGNPPGGIRVNVNIRVNFASTPSASSSVMGEASGSGTNTLTSSNNNVNVTDASCGNPGGLSRSIDYSDGSPGSSRSTANNHGPRNGSSVSTNDRNHGDSGNHDGSSTNAAVNCSDGLNGSSGSNTNKRYSDGSPGSSQSTPIIIDDDVSDDSPENSTGNTTVTPLVSTAPVNTAPVNTAPVNTAPANIAPVNTAPVNTAPVNTAPVNTAPANSPPVNLPFFGPPTWTEWAVERARNRALIYRTHPSSPLCHSVMNSSDLVWNDRLGLYELIPEGDVREVHELDDLGQMHQTSDIADGTNGSTIYVATVAPDQNTDEPEGGPKLGRPKGSGKGKAKGTEAKGKGKATEAKGKGKGRATEARGKGKAKAAEAKGKGKATETKGKAKGRGKR